MRSRFDCGGLRQFERSVPPPSEEGGRVTINDAYDWNSDGTGSTRPNLGEGYEEVLPPTSVKLTISANSDIRFKGGHTEYTLEIGKVLKPTDFDESTTGGRTVGGVVLPNEDGSIKSIIPLNDFCPLEETEIVPYFAPEKGDLALYASGSLGDHYFDENGNDLSKNIDYKLSAETMLSGGFVVRKITAPRELNNGTNFRAVTPQPRVSGRVYVYHYDIKNFGDEEVSLTVYQMNTGGNIYDTNTFVKSDKLTLAPGETKTVSIKVRNEKNDSNSLTQIELNCDVKALSLGVMMSREDVTPSRTVTITLNLSDGFTVADSYKREVRTGDILTLPANSQITNNTGHNLIRWIYSNSNRTPVTAGVKIDADMAIEPLLTEDVKIELVQLPAGFAVASDYKTLRQTGDLLVLPTEQQITNETPHHFLYWAYEDGGRVNDGLVLKENLRLKPVFTNDVTVTLDLPENLSVSGDYARVAQEGDKLVLPADGQITNNTGHKIIRWVDSKGNQVTNETVLRRDITIKPELSQSATVNVKLPAGLTLSADYNKTTETGEKLVVPAAAQVTGTIPNGRTIEGWYIVGNGNRIVDENTVIWDRELTIAPYFSRMNGTQNLVGITNPADSNGKPLVFGNEQGNSKPQRVVNGDVTSNAAFYGAASRFENTVAVGGGNGFAELGSEFGYNGTLVKGAEFRYATKVTDGAAVVSIKKAHTFYYNFENFGTSAADFDIQGVNSGGDCEGPRTRICLAPGESIRVSYTVTYNLGGANKNIMVYFFFNEEVVNLKLGVSVNVVLDSANKNIEDETVPTPQTAISKTDIIDNRRED